MFPREGSPQNNVLIFYEGQLCSRLDSLEARDTAQWEGMYMSAEVISIILVAAGVLITLGGGLLAGLAWSLRRMEELFDKVDKRFEKIDERFDKVDQRFDKVDQRFDKVDQRFEKMDERISQVQTELNDVKVAVARLEGPHPRLIFPR
ncbi:hypothetical protein GCM10022249_15510 [Enteractinococcus coprophilus]